MLRSQAQNLRRDGPSKRVDTPLVLETLIKLEVGHYMKVSLSRHLYYYISLAIVLFCFGEFTGNSKI